MNIFYDEDTVIYLNGVKIAELAGYNIKYEAVELDQAVIKKTLKQGKNVLAIHTINKGGGAYIDVGFDAISYK